MRGFHLKPWSTAVLLGLSFALGVAFASGLPFARASEARGIEFAGSAIPADSAAPSGTAARLTYQGRLIQSNGVPVNAPLNTTFRLYDRLGSAVYTATRTITPTNGLFTIYLGDGTDPELDDYMLAQTASLGVSIGGVELTPRQPLHSLVAHSETSAAVTGSSNTRIGVQGFSNSNNAIYGYSVSGKAVRAQSDSGRGVVGSSESNIGIEGASNTGTGISAFSFYGNGLVASTNTITRAAVVASNGSAAGTALQIDQGGIKANGAGVGTHTFAFIHRSDGANVTANKTYIDNVLTNGDQNAMLFVTHVNNPTGIQNNGFNRSIGVFYETSASKWAIYAEDGAAFGTDITFNVMVIKR